MNLQFKDTDTAHTGEKLKRKYLQRRKQVWVQQQFKVKAAEATNKLAKVSINISINIS